EPDIFLLAAGKIGCAPEDCYVFEDGSNGARAGVAAGCATVMIPDLMQPTEDLLKECAGIYSSLLEARDAIAAGEL
ncbi:MAG: HAD family hydrolase, partial [Oscillospiraceae bacterium]|nr:HAD family hydrolase [Oscillospiraceae bacterium]